MIILTKRISILTVLVFCLYYFSLSYAHDSGNNIEILVTKDGFSPKSITVPVGSEVVFKNVDSEKHWPASDDHPSHTNYNGHRLEENCVNGINVQDAFDACHGLLSEEAWKFVPRKTGVYSYHDHLWPQFIGSLEVVKNDTPSIEISFFDKISLSFKSFFSKIKKLFFSKKPVITELNNGDTQNTFYILQKERFKKITTDDDPRKAIELLRLESTTNPQLNAFCHDILHVIGKEAYAKYGNFKDSIIYQSDFCNSGYIHGVFTAFFEREKDPVKSAALECTSLGPNVSSYDIWQCYHGIGHGLMYYTGGDLHKSLELCNESIDSEHVNICYNGVYMEVFNLEILPKESSFVNADNPFELCHTAVLGKNDCYTYIPTYLLQTKRLPTSEVFALCNNIEKPFLDDCIRGTAAEETKRNMLLKEKLFDICSDLDFSQRNICAEGVVSMYMNQTASYEEGSKLCGKNNIFNTFSCYSSIQKYKTFYSK